MQQGTEEQGIRGIRADIARVFQWIPPLWDLPNSVAVNPFLGFAEETPARAARTLKDGLGAETLPPVSFSRARWRDGAFGLPDLAEAVRRFGGDPALLERILNGEAGVTTRTAQEVRTYAERHDAQHETSWNTFLVNAATRWCAAVTARQDDSFGLGVGQQGLYESWREAAGSDRSPEIAGLAGWRSWADGLPSSAEEAIDEMLVRLDVSAADRTLYLYRLLGGVYGWASFFRRSSWEAGTDTPGPLLDLLALRICGDAAVPALAQRSRNASTRESRQILEDESIRFVFQEALENGFVRSLAAKLASAPQTSRSERPAVQAVFCIDVRSEPLRRHLEAVSELESVSEAVETLGFAGFFGVSLSWQEGGAVSARCPVLLKPTVKASSAAPALPGFAKTLKSLQSAPAASFSFVELLGAVYGVGLASDALTNSSQKASSEDTARFEFGTEMQDRLELAASILKNLGLRSRFSRLVLLCGHQGNSANNPHAASLNCGACGGHSGAINARVAAALLNDPSVQTWLRKRGFDVPDDTYFLPGIHDTSTDEVTLLDTDQAPQSHGSDLARLRRWLGEAAERTRQERAPALGLVFKSPGALGKSPGTLEKLFRRRAGDWSEVRPEWGLARNAAFIAARRVRTRGINLEGRAFLHEYDWTTDPDNSILGLILSAPMVVASWINLQYFASTVDNAVFGCGTKALHNRVGDLGVVLGNGGDLRPGLPLQSVHAPDGRWHHEPLRLQVVVEAPPDRIDAALSVHAGVQTLVENGWVRLYALDPAGSALSRWDAQGWQTDIF